MKLLITGASGFLGRHTVRAALGAGHAVRGLDLKAWPGAAGAPDVLDMRVGDITDEAALAPALSDVEGVVHLAAFPHLWARDPRVYEDLNHEGARRVAVAARASGVRRFVLASSPTVFAATRLARLGRPLNEDDVAEPAELPAGYPRSKRRAEEAVLALNGDNFAAMSVIPTVPLGPGDDSLTPPTRMIADLAAGRTPALLDTMMNMIDVRDAAQGLIAAIERGRAGARHLLNGAAVGLADLAGRIAAKSGVRAPRARVPGAVALMAAHASEVIARLGGPPPVAPVAGVLAALRSRPLDDRATRALLQLEARPLDPALDAALEDLRARGML